MKLTYEQYREILQRPGISKANTHLGAVARPKHTEPATALECVTSTESSRGKSLAISVAIVGFRQRKLDDDNFVAGAKPLRDSIAETLGIDDGSDRIKFTYAQVICPGLPGTIVCIQIV